MAAAQQSKTSTPAAKAKPFVLCQINESEDPSAADPFYFTSNEKKFIVPRGQPFVVEYDAISHLMEPEERIVSKQNPRTGDWSNHAKKLTYNKPEIMQWMTAEEAAPYLEKQRRGSMAALKADKQKAKAEVMGADTVDE